jgi:hypothetical protein
MFGWTFRRIALGLLLFTVIPSSAVRAANGDLVSEVHFSSACPASNYGGLRIGVGIAFDGTSLWYSCAGTGAQPDLYKADPITGTVTASYNVAGGLGALAWDGKRKKIWAGWGGSSASPTVRLIDPATGVGTAMFIASAISDDLDDGLAYDFQADSLFISPDGSTTIYQYSTTGTLLASFRWTGTGCYNSGLAIGGNLLFQGSDGCNHVWVINRNDHSAAFDFPTGADGVRDEDLECDSVTFSPRTVMWSMEAYEPRRAIAFEIPSGSCGTGGGVDSDGDGLLDEWETNGVTIDPDGDGPLPPQFIDLPAMGADPQKPDIFLQIDWMDCAQAGGDCAALDTHSHHLDPTAVKKVVDAFAVAPYTSPTGSKGINLHVDQGPGSILNFTNNATWGALSKATALTHVNSIGAFVGGSYEWTAFQAIKDAGFTKTGRTPIFHYVISAHNYAGTTSSGISRGIGASDLIESLGSWPFQIGTVNQQAGTLMHELGHNLSLRHGGQDDVNYKPDYLSIMNYAFQTQGLIMGGVGGNFDYSKLQLPSLNENMLNEPAGLGPLAAGYGTRYFCTGGVNKVTNVASGPIDWDCSGTATGTAAVGDINNDTVRNILAGGFNDWANLKFKGGAIGQAGVAPVLPSHSDPDPLTVAVDQQISPCTNCQSQLAPGGGRAKTDCGHEWQTTPAPARNTHGMITNRLQCTDGDASCDFGATPGECTFRVALCLNLTMPLSGLPTCTPTDVAKLQLISPREAAPKNGVDAANRDALEGVLQDVGGVVGGLCTAPRPLRGRACTTSSDCDSAPQSGDGVCTGRFVAFTPPLNAADHCTAFANIRVPLSATRGKGTKKLALKVVPSTDPVTGKMRAADLDSLTLTCNP